LFSSSFLFVFWYHSPNFLDKHRRCYRVLRQTPKEAFPDNLQKLWWTLPTVFCQG
jgi:hypothetical protein